MCVCVFLKLDLHVRGCACMQCLHEREIVSVCVCDFTYLCVCARVCIGTYTSVPLGCAQTHIALNLHNRHTRASLHIFPMNDIALTPILSVPIYLQLKYIFMIIVD